jgi:hypothetical protein
MPKSIKPRPNNQRETLDEILSSEAVDPTSGRPVVKDRNRGDDVSTKGDQVKDVSIGIVDIDSAIIKYIETKIKPSIIQDGNRIQVPVMYGYPERWQTIQEKGILREYSGRMIAPVIVLKRNSLEANRSLGTKIDANKPQNLYVFEQSYTKKNQYDNFAVLGNRIPVKEYRLIVTPEYVTLKYSCVIFTNHLEQNNKIIEALQYAANTYWGEEGRFQFRANIDSFATATEYAIGEDRTIRTNFDITLNGYIIPDTVNRDISYPKKFLSKAQIVFNLETDVEDIFTIAVAPKDTFKPQAVNFPTQPQTITAAIDPNVLLYLNANVTKTTSNITSPGTATFNNTNILNPPAGSGIVAPTKNDFLYFINSANVSTTLVTSITQVGSDVVVVFDTAGLGYTIDSSDVIAVVGKFS